MTPDAWEDVLLEQIDRLRKSRRWSWVLAVLTSAIVGGGAGELGAHQSTPAGTPSPEATQPGIGYPNLLTYDTARNRTNTNFVIQDVNGNPQLTLNRLAPDASLPANWTMTATTFRGQNNADVSFGQQGTSKFIVHFPTGNGAGSNADSAFIDSDGVHMGRATGQRFDSNGQNFQIGQGVGGTESITIAPGTGAATLAAVVGATGQITFSVGGSVDLQDTTGGLDIAHASGRPANATFGMKVASGTTMLHLDHGTVTLVAGAGTATLSSAFEHCACTDATAVAAVKCNISGSTTMTITGTGTDVITYFCVN